MKRFWGVSDQKLMIEGIEEKWGEIKLKWSDGRWK